jgi:Zn-dependent protease with chaperone function
LFLLLVPALLSAQGKVQKSDDWLVGRPQHAVLDRLEREADFPNVPLSSGLVVVVTIGGASSESLVIGPVAGAAPRYAEVLNGWQREFGGTNAVYWSQEDDAAAAVLKDQRGRIGASTSTMALPVGVLLQRLRSEAQDVKLAVRLPLHARLHSAPKPVAESKGYVYYDLSAASVETILRVSARLPAWAPWLFWGFFAFVPLVAFAALGAGAWYGSRSGIPIARRRKFYPKIVQYPIYGSMAVHAPFAFFTLTSRQLYPIADLWLGSTSALVFSPLLFAPLPVLFLSTFLMARIERKLFGATENGKSDIPPPPEPTPEMRQHLAQIQRVSYLIAGIGIAFLIAGWVFIDRKAVGSGLVRFGGISILFLSSSLARVICRRSVEIHESPVGDPVLEAEVRELADRMETAVRSAKVDRSALIVDSVYASVTRSGDVRVSPRVVIELSQEERRFLLAHELAHLKLRHFRQRLIWVYAPYILGTAPVLTVFLSLSRPEFPKLPPGYAFGSMVIAGAYMAVAVRILFKRQEYEADRLALEVTGNLDAAESALRKSMFGWTMPHMHDIDDQSTHPAMSRRIDALRKLHGVA